MDAKTQLSAKSFLTESEIMKYIPKTVSRDIHKFIDDEVLLRSRYIFFENNKPNQVGYCTHCKKTFHPTTRWKHKAEYVCNNCGSAIKAINNKFGHKYLRNDSYFTYYEKSPIDDQAIVARTFYVSRSYASSHLKFETKIFCESCYLFRWGKTSQMVTLHGWWGESKTISDKIEYKNPQKTSTVYSSMNRHTFSDRYCSAKNVGEAIMNTPFRYLPIETFENREDFVDLIDLYNRYPSVEKLIKIGLHEIINIKLNGWKTYASINWNGNTIQKILKMDKSAIRIFLGMHKKKGFSHSTTEVLRIFQLCYSRGLVLNEYQFYTALRLFNNGPELLSSHITLVRPLTLMDYLVKQGEKFRKNNISSSGIFKYWTDYIQDCKTLEYDLKSKQTLYPKDLYEAHQRTILLAKYQENEYLTNKILERVGEFQGKYNFESSGLFIRPALSSKEIIDEGKMLSHCVGQYIKPYAEGKTIILVVRKLERPDTPYFTVEMSNSDSILQSRGYKNLDPDQAGLDFMLKFKKNLLKIKSPKKAKTKIPA